MKLWKNIKFYLFEGWPLILIVIGIVIIWYSVYYHASSADGIEWLAKPLTDATMKDALGIGGILAVLHSMMSRGN